MKKNIIFFLSMIIIVCNCHKNDQITGPDNVIKNDYDVLLNGKIVTSTGFGMGVDDAIQLRNWIQQDSLFMSLNYPGNLSWGSVFITVGGDPKNPPRPWIDISACTKLSIEMKGAVGGEGVLIGMKDKDDPDDGTETKKAVYLTKDWNIYEFQLSDFTTCDLTKVYVVTEFVFPCGTSNKAVSINVKNITILK
jgi:hypothetical protein